MNQKFSTKKNEKGQGLVEYTLVAVLIIIPLIGGLSLFGPEIKVMVTNLTFSISGGYTVQNGVLIYGASPTPTGTSAPGAPIATSTSAPAATSVPTYTLVPTFTLTKTATTTQTVTKTQTATSTLTATSTRTATSTLTTTLTPTATPFGTWITCANENGFCSFSGTTQVQYGANGVWVTQTFTDGVACTNAIFGDPISGVVKTCQYYQITPATPTSTATPVPSWKTCANENGFCSFSGTAQVRYGANGIWFTQTRTNGVACTNAVFGDPISGVAKTCQVYQ